MAYTTLQELKDWLEIEITKWDEILNLINETSSKIIDKFCNRTFGVTEYMETYFLKNQDTLRLNHYPVGATYAFIFEGETESLVEGVDYFIKRDVGVIYFLDGNNNFKFVSGRLEAYYYAGVEVDSFIKLTCLRIGDYLWKKRRAEGLSAERIGDYSSSFYEAALIEILDPLKQYIKDVI